MEHLWKMLMFSLPLPFSSLSIKSWALKRVNRHYWSLHNFQCSSGLPFEAYHFWINLSSTRMIPRLKAVVTNANEKFKLWKVHCERGAWKGECKAHFSRFPCNATQIWVGPRLPINHWGMGYTLAKTPTCQNNRKEGSFPVLSHLASYQLFKDDIRQWKFSFNSRAIYINMNQWKLVFARVTR